MKLVFKSFPAREPSGGRDARPRRAPLWGVYEHVGFFSVCNREIASKTLYKLLPFCVVPELTGVIGVVAVVDGVVITLRMYAKWRELHAFSTTSSSLAPTSCFSRFSQGVPAFILVDMESKNIHRRK